MHLRLCAFAEEKANAGHLHLASLLWLRLTLEQCDLVNILVTEYVNVPGAWHIQRP